MRTGGWRVAFPFLLVLRARFRPPIFQLLPFVCRLSFRNMSKQKKGQTWNESYLLPPFYVNVLFYGQPLHHQDLAALCGTVATTAFCISVNEMKHSLRKKYINLEIEEGGQSSKWFVDPKQVSFLFWRSLFLLAGSIQDFGRKSSRTAYVYVGDSSFVSVRTKTGFFWNEKENSGILNKLKIGKCE